MNAVNFVDGLDGLAAGIVGIAAIAFFGYSYSISKDFAPNVFSVGSLVAAALVGCCLGFLPHNFNPAKIFMGDSGAMLLGLLLSASTISLIGSLDPQSVGDERQQNLLYLFPLLMPLAVLVVPLLDLVLAVVRRTRAGKSPFHPDAKHLHHQPARAGPQPRRCCRRALPLDGGGRAGRRLVRAGAGPLRRAGRRRAGPARADDHARRAARAARGSTHGHPAHRVLTHAVVAIR
ncbi:hypothetical protein GCM10025868_38640 [Angustibacter aerolatus]|uniref:Phospho-N-acetylmuramoyl-pentapeptide-transferase n=1 Tax=Angustibacter aerolatus TaxID=1162965 RepID=A0ABQ6JMQ9_9ACTN|nr:hypothetical protein GCM10025868_38640 [Angustibacter aerolatus]